MDNICKPFLFSHNFGQAFVQMFGQVFDQIFGQGFDQGLGEGKNINTMYSTTRPKEKKLTNQWKKKRKKNIFKIL